MSIKSNIVEETIFHKISELHLDGKVMVEDVVITGFLVPRFVDEENKHGNLDVVNALAKYIQNVGQTQIIKFKMDDESDDKKRVYVLTNLPKLSMFHKYYTVDVKFTVYVQNGKLVISTGGENV